MNFKFWGKYFPFPRRDGTREGNRRTDKSFWDPSVFKLLPCLNNIETKKKLAYYFPLPRQSFIFPKFCHWPCQTEWKVFFPNCVDDFERFSGSVCRVLRKFVRRFSPTAPFYLINTSNIFSICQIHLGMVQELCKNRKENTLVSENWPFTYFGWKHTLSLKQQFFIIQQPLFGTKWRNCSCVRILFSKNTQVFSSPADNSMFSIFYPRSSPCFISPRKNVNIYLYWT